MLYTKKLSVGNRALDSEHRQLLNIAEEIARLVASSNSAFLSEAFVQMENRLHACSLLKESIAHAVGADCSRLQQSRKNLLDKIRQVRATLFEEGGPLSEREKCLRAHALSEHLIHYITVDCRPLKIVLDTHYYDFMPDNPVPA